MEKTSDKTIDKLLNSPILADQLIGVELLVRKLRNDIDETYVGCLNPRIEGKHICITTPAANPDWDNLVFKAVKEIYKYPRINPYIDWNANTHRCIKIHINVLQ